MRLLGSFGAFLFLAVAATPGCGLLDSGGGGGTPDLGDACPGTPAPGHPAYHFYDCGLPECASSTFCVTPGSGSTVGAVVACGTRGTPESSCTDGIDNNHDGRIDCLDCSCCQDPACADAASCRCDALTSHSSGHWFLNAHGGIPGTPACASGSFIDQIDIGQDGCTVELSFRSPSGMIISPMHSTPIPFDPKAPHLYRVYFDIVDVDTPTAHDEWIFNLLFDMQKGSVVGTEKRIATGVTTVECGVASVP